MQFLRRLVATLVVTMMGGAALASGALAQQPRNWQLGMQPAFSPVQQRVEDLHTGVLITITAITVLVGVLLLIVMFRFNRRANPTPSRTSHHTWLEVAWTVFPILILVGIAIPSFRLVYYEDRTRDADMTLKVTAHQWNWEYTYPDQDNLDFTSYVLADADARAQGKLRLLDVDNQLVVPVGKNIRVLITSTDVIHSFFIPSLGVQRYAIPGRTIETWMRVIQPGTYYGECNQICGANHSRMPISVRALPEAEFNAWVADAKKKFAADAPPGESPGAPPGAPSGAQAGVRLTAMTELRR